MGKGKNNTTIRRQAYAAGFEAGVACDNEIWLEAIRRTTSLTPEQVQELANNVIQVAHERSEILNDKVQQSGDLQLDERNPGNEEQLGIVAFDGQ